MERKWWYLVFIFLMLAVVTLVVAEFFGRDKVQKIQGGIIIVNPTYQFPDVGKEKSNTVPPEESQTSASDEEGILPPVQESGCWECPEGGIILNMALEDLTEQLVQKLTNCTNVTQLVQIDCPTNITNQTNLTCGNGICEGDESVKSCPEDCASSEEGSGGDEGNGEDSGFVEESEETSQESGAEEEPIGYYYRLTFDKKRCVGLILRPGDERKESNCDPKNPDAILSGQVTDDEPSLSPFKETFSTYLLKRMFGLP